MNNENNTNGGFDNLYPQQPEPIVPEANAVPETPSAIPQPTAASYPYYPDPQPSPAYTYQQSQPYGYTPPAQPEPKEAQYDNGLVVASLVMGISSFFFCCNFLQAIVGLILGICAKTPKKGMKIAAIIINSVVLAIGLIFWIYAFAASSSGYNSVMNEIFNGIDPYGYYDYSSLTL